MQIKIAQRDDVLRRFGNRLASLGEEGANTVMMRALNHEGDKLRTQVKRALVRQTGIQYGKINHAVRTISAFGSRLTYTIEGRGGETNLKSRRRSTACRSSSCSSTRDFDRARSSRCRSTASTSSAADFAAWCGRRRAHRSR